MLWKARIADFEKKFAATHLATPPPPAPKLERQNAHQASDSDTESWETESDVGSDTELNTIYKLCKIVNDFVMTTEIYHTIFPEENHIQIVDKPLKN